MHIIGCCPSLFVASQYLLHADMTTSWVVVLLKILLWSQKCRIYLLDTEPAS